MSTLKQRDANRRNATQSTGPKSPAGKAASSQNSLKHGVCVSDLTLFHDLETEAGFQARLDEYLDFHQPATPDERDAIEDIVLTRIRLRRALRAETGLLDEARVNLYGVKAKPNAEGEVRPYFLFDRVPPAEQRIIANRHLGVAWQKVSEPIDRLSRYEARLASRLDKLKRELALLQANRRKEEETVIENTLPEPPQPAVQNEPNSDLTPVVATPVSPVPAPLQTPATPVEPPSTPDAPIGAPPAASVPPDGPVPPSELGIENQLA